MELNVEFLEKVRKLADFAHYGQFRNDGVTPYITHPAAVSLLVADYCAEYKVDFDPSEAIATALLHDVVEDTDVPLKEILEADWNPYPFLYSRVFHLSHKSKRCPGILFAHKYERWVRLLDGDKIEMLVKVCDRLHNTEDFAKFSQSKQARIREETIKYIVPLANVLDKAYSSELVKQLTANVL